MAFMPFQKG